MYRILITDDEEMIRKLIRKYAEFEGHEVVEACNGMEALIEVKNSSFDIIIMDIMMPELDGFSACREIRKTSDVPIIMLSARGEEYDKINGFEIGIDDYVMKPFSPKELMLRVNAIIKRSKANAKPVEPENEILSLADGGLVVDFTARIVYIDGVRANMSPKEYDLFFYLLGDCLKSQYIWRCARGTLGNRCPLISAIMAYQFLSSVMLGQRHVTVRTFDYLTAVSAGYKSRITATV